MFHCFASLVLGVSRYQRWVLPITGSQQEASLINETYREGPGCEKMNRELAAPALGRGHQGLEQTRDLYKISYGAELLRAEISTVGIGGISRPELGELRD